MWPEFVRLTTEWKFLGPIVQNNVVSVSLKFQFKFLVEKM